jgi:hypothetical protein
MVVAHEDSNLGRALLADRNEDCPRRKGAD